MGEFAGKTVLVTGATGFLGGALALRLASEGIHVRALGRNHDRKGAHLRNNANIEALTGDITDIDRMRDVTSDCDCVIHAAVNYGKRTSQQRVNIDGTRHVVQTATENNVRRVVHISSIAVYGYHVVGDINEDDPLTTGPEAYSMTKAEAERVVRSVGDENGLEYSIVRPGMIYGPRSKTWTRNLFKLARRKPMPFLGDGSGSVHPIHVDDVVDLCLTCATHPAAVGEAFNCTPDPSPTWREFLGLYAQLAGHNRWLPLPPVLGTHIIAPIGEVVARLRGEPQELPTLARYIQRRVTYKMDKARNLLNWQPQIDLQSGVASCVSWLREQGLLQ
ncbi:MAG: SDR family NAD(P)-dependent oxidoreductase [Chloroflexi bacterium]|nr:MAG: SDR family NAD(P)-dependent oxidoreductase [Chloroflexota bacterium]